MRFTEQFQVVQAVAPDADAFAGSVTGDVINTKNFSTVTFLVQHAAGATGTYKIQVEECSAADGSDNVAVAFRYRQRAVGAAWGALTAVAAATGFTVTAGENQLVAVELDAAELSDGKPFVRIITTEVVDSPVDGAILAILGGARYPGATLDTALA